MKPLPDRAKEGRVNPKGIPCLYCSTEIRTAMGEVRPWIGSYVSANEPSGTELERLKQIYYLVYPDGLNRASWPGLIYIRAKPKSIRYSDYNQNPQEIVEFRVEDLSR